MSQTKCINANVTKANGAMTIAQAGAVSTSDVTKQDFSLSELNTINKSAYGTHVYLGNTTGSSGNLGTFRPLTASDFGYQAKNKYIIPQVSAYIAGVASTLLISPSNKISPRAFNKLGAVHTAYLTVMTWTGGNDGLPTYTKTVSSQTPSFGTDNAAKDITDFTFRTGKPLPVTQAYITPNSD